MSSANFEFVNDGDDILSLLHKSKDFTLAIGIRSDKLGPGIYVTCVENISLEGDFMVVLKPYDATGKMLETNRLRLSEILSVLPFNSKFQNPFHKTTQFINSKLDNE
jgi:hypothetical protein